MQKKKQPRLCIRTPEITGALMSRRDLSSVEFWACAGVNLDRRHYYSHRTISIHETMFQDANKCHNKHIFTINKGLLCFIPGFIRSKGTIRESLSISLY